MQPGGLAADIGEMKARIGIAQSTTDRYGSEVASFILSTLQLKMSVTIQNTAQNQSIHVRYTMY
jgi:hypothetical protein